MIKQKLKSVILLFVFNLSCYSWAGGDAWPMTVTGDISQEPPYRFTLIPLRENGAFPSCKQIQFQVDPPWWAGLTMIGDELPTHSETQLAIKALRYVSQTGEMIQFGFIGRGWVNGETACSYISRGLYIAPESDNYSGAVILSRYFEHRFFH
ncbi:hypothetical protein [Algicola sagamiensis]|uniref:hypothetical protein n=1 Tax=Algicola sagamiensis TaxID=163869 RepID=UPI000361A4BD|nr:hypothetical protein [Algicola sagamiensis]